MRKSTDLRPQTCRPQLCAPANLYAVIKVRSGVLVTTAWLSAKTKAFAARNNRLRIIEGGELKHLLAEYLHLDVRIDLDRPNRRAP